MDREAKKWAKREQRKKVQKAVKPEPFELLKQPSKSEVEDAFKSIREMARCLEATCIVADSVSGLSELSSIGASGHSFTPNYKSRRRATIWGDKPTVSTGGGGGRILGKKIDAVFLDEYADMKPGLFESEYLLKVREGFKPGEMTLFGGGREVGKSSFFGQFAKGLDAFGDTLSTGVSAALSKSFLMTPEQLAAAKETRRVQMELEELEQIQLEAERDSFGYGGW